MENASKPVISAVLAAYQSEPWIAEAIDSILGQTRPPDEVVVVDDGSTDGTAAILASYGERVRVVRQENSGYPVAMNRAIRESRGEIVAPCGADDIWEPRKLEWQEEALAAHPGLGVLFGHAVFFGRIESDHVRPTGTGVLDGQELLGDLFRDNVINMPSALIRRELLDRVGWFTDGFLADDFEFFFNCLRAGVAFHYEPRTLVRYRRHEHNITNSNRELHEAMLLVRSRNADLLADRQLVSTALAEDLFRIGRELLDEGQPERARQAIRRSLRHSRGRGPYWKARALGWLALLSLPALLKDPVVHGLLGLRGATIGALEDNRRLSTS